MRISLTQSGFVNALGRRVGVLAAIAAVALSLRLGLVTHRPVFSPQHNPGAGVAFLVLTAILANSQPLGPDFIQSDDVTPFIFKCASGARAADAGVNAGLRGDIQRVAA